MNLVQFQAIRKFSTSKSSKIELSKDLWTELLNNGARCLPKNTDNDKEALIISITFQNSSFNINNSSKSTLENVITEAYLKESENENNKNENEISVDNKEEYICYISDEWYKNHLSISKNIDKLYVEPTGIIELDEVYINANDEISYVKAEENKDFILNYIIKKKAIIKQNTILTIENDNQQYSYDILMCLPVLQGCVDENTKILLSNYKVNVNHFEKEKIQENVITEDHAFDVDYDIMSDNLLGLSNELAALNNDSSLYFPISEDDEKDKYTRKNEFNKLCLNAKMLTKAIPENILEPPPEEADDSDARIYVSINTLMKLQTTLNGNWVY